MKLKELCEINNIEYNKEHPKRSLEKLQKIYVLEKNGRDYNIVRELSADEQIQISKLTKCKELLEEEICYQLSNSGSNTINNDMKGFLELFGIVNSNYKFFSYNNVTKEKMELLLGTDLDNNTLYYFVEDVNPILYRMVKEVWRKMEKEMLIYVKEHLMLCKKYKYDNEEGTVEYTRKTVATNDQIETYMRLYREKANALGYKVEEVKYWDGKEIKRQVCKEMGFDWIYTEYELVLNRVGLKNENQKRELLNKNVIHKLNQSNQGRLKDYNKEIKSACIDFLIKTDSRSI